MYKTIDPREKKLAIFEKNNFIQDKSCFSASIITQFKLLFYFDTGMQLYTGTKILNNIKIRRYIQVGL